MSADHNQGSATDPIVRFEKVTKAFGELTVLRELDFEVGPQEKITIVGPSGSGKTTILRVLMTLEEPNDGVIWVDDERIEYYGISGNVLTNIKRGTKGTSITDHAAGTTAYDGTSEGQRKASAPGAGKNRHGFSTF